MLLNETLLQSEFKLQLRINGFARIDEDGKYINHDSFMRLGYFQEDTDPTLINFVDGKTKYVFPIYPNTIYVIQYSNNGFTFLCEHMDELFREFRAYCRENMVPINFYAVKDFLHEKHPELKHVYYSSVQFAFLEPIPMSPNNLNKVLTMFNNIGIDKPFYINNCSRGVVGGIGYPELSRRDKVWLASKLALDNDLHNILSELEEADCNIDKDFTNFMNEMKYLQKDILGGTPFQNILRFIAQNLNAMYIGNNGIGIVLPHKDINNGQGFLFIKAIWNLAKHIATALASKDIIYNNKTMSKDDYLNNLMKDVEDIDKKKKKLTGNIDSAKKVEIEKKLYSLYKLFTDGHSPEEEISKHSESDLYKFKKNFNILNNIPEEDAYSILNGIERYFNDSCTAKIINLMKQLGLKISQSLYNAAFYVDKATFWNDVSTDMLSDMNIKLLANGFVGNDSNESKPKSTKEWAGRGKALSEICKISNKVNNLSEYDLLDIIKWFPECVDSLSEQVSKLQLLDLKNVVEYWFELVDPSRFDKALKNQKLKDAFAMHVKEFNNYSNGTKVEYVLVTPSLLKYIDKISPSMIASLLGNLEKKSSQRVSYEDDYESGDDYFRDNMKQLINTGKVTQEQFDAIRNIGRKFYDNPYSNLLNDEREYRKWLFDGEEEKYLWVH